jgi:two-component system, NarL family, sensor histidine kinase DesK
VWIANHEGVSHDDRDLDDRRRRTMTEITPRAGRAPDPPAPYRRRNHFVVYLFLLSLAGPASDIGGTARPAWLSALALAAFVACFVALVELAPHWRSFGSECPPSALARRLRPPLVVAIALLAVATTLAWGSNWLVLFIFVVVTVVETVPSRFSVASLFGVALVAGACGLRGHTDAASVATAAAWMLSTIMAGYISLLLHRRNALIGELRASRDEVARLAAADAVAEERLRFARDLHDLLGHSLSVIVLKAELARRRLERGEHDEARDEVNDLEQVARRSLEEVREAVTGYRVRSLDAEIDGAREVLEAAGIDVTIALASDAALPPDIDQLLAWVVREATTNIVRHSSARHAGIDLARVGAVVRLEVSDDGAGMAPAGAAQGRRAGDGPRGGSGDATGDGPRDAMGDAPGGGPGKSQSGEVGDRPGGSGLSGLAERLAQAGGRLEAGPRVGGGFRVAAVVPLAGMAPASVTATDAAAVSPP